MPSRGAKFCRDGEAGHGCAADPLLPSMITWFLLRPRMCRSRVPTQTPACQVGLFSWYTPGQIRIQLPGLAASTAACTVPYWWCRVAGHGVTLPLQTSSTLVAGRVAGELAAAWPAASVSALAARTRAPPKRREGRIADLLLRLGGTSAGPTLGGRSGDRNCTLSDREEPPTKNPSMRGAARP